MGIRSNRLGWLQEQIAETIGVTRGRIAQIVNNTNFSEINTLLSQGRDMDYIARHYSMDLTLARPIRLRRFRWRACLGHMVRRENRPGKVQGAWLGTSHHGCFSISTPKPGSRFQVHACSRWSRLHLIWFLIWYVIVTEIPSEAAPTSCDLEHISASLEGDLQSNTVSSLLNQWNLLSIQ